jgi:hypothetical protein
MTSPNKEWPLLMLQFRVMLKMDLVYLDEGPGPGKVLRLRGSMLVF